MRSNPLIQLNISHRAGHQHTNIINDSRKLLQTSSNNTGVPITLNHLPQTGPCTLSLWSDWGIPDRQAIIAPNFLNHLCRHQETWSLQSLVGLTVVLWSSIYSEAKSVTSVSDNRITKLFSHLEFGWLYKGTSSQAWPEHSFHFIFSTITACQEQQYYNVMSEWWLIHSML